MNEYEWYVLYCSLKAHFNQKKFNYFDRQDHSGLFTVSKYETRNDKHYFRRLSKRYKNHDKRFAEMFFASNMVRSPDIWIGDITDEESAAVAYHSIATIDAIEYRVLEDFKKLLSHVDEWKHVFFKTKYELPLCYRHMLSNKVTPESLVVLNKVLDINTIISDNIDHVSVPIWTQINTRIYKYTPFVILQDVDTVRRIKQGLRHCIMTHEETKNRK